MKKYMMPTVDHTEEEWMSTKDKKPFERPSCFTLPLHLLEAHPETLEAGFKTKNESKLSRLALFTLLWTAHKHGNRVKVEYLINRHDDADPNFETGLMGCVGIRFWFDSEIHANVINAVKSDDVPVTNELDFLKILHILVKGAPLPERFDKFYAHSLKKLLEFGASSNLHSINAKQIDCTNYLYQGSHPPKGFPYPKMTYSIPSDTVHPDIFLNSILPRFKGSSTKGLGSEEWKETAMTLLCDKYCPQQKKRKLKK